MAQNNSSNATLVVTTIGVALIAFGGGYFVGSYNTGDGAAAPEAQPGAAKAPGFAKGQAEGSGGGQGNLQDSDIIPVGDSPIKGNKDALVTVIEFSDFQCPFCQRGANTLEQLQRKYPEDVRIVFKNFPLGFHKQAPDAARAALAAGEQGKYWQMHDKLFENYKNFRGQSDMKTYTASLAEEIGLDVEQFKEDFDKPEFGQQIKEDQKLGQKLGVRGTPHFFINGVRLSGAQPLNKFEDVVKQQLAESKKIGAPAAYKTLVAKNFKKAEPPKPKNNKPKAKKVEYVPVDDDDAMMGNTKDPLVTIVEFSDYQCPFCKRGDDNIKAVMKKYNDNTRLVYKHLPLPFHKQAEPAARAAVAAGNQDKFWEMHDKIFSNQKALKTAEIDALLEGYARELGLNMAKFKADYNSPEVAKQVKEDAALAGKVGARGTPNFFINGIQLVGAQPPAAFDAEMEEQLKLAKKFKKEKGLSGEALYKELAAHNKKNAPKAAPTPQKPDPKVDMNKLSVGNSYTKGPANAPVKIYEFSDFQCPFCQRGANTIDDVVEQYGDKVQVIFKAYPLPFHKQADQAHRAAIAAGKQGTDKFWKMHDKLFANQRAFKTGDMDELMKQYAGELGLNVDKFMKDYNSPAVAKQVEAEMEMGKGVGVRGTPNFVINGTRLTGAQPLPKFKAAIDAALKK